MAKKEQAGMKRILCFLLAIAFAGHSNAASPRPATATHGMVVSSQRLASAAGVEVLQAGGNAVDAAVATAFALAVVHPSAGNIGGGGFMVIRFPDGHATTIDFRETAPLLASRDMYLRPDGSVDEEKSRIGYLAAGVPGSVAGLCMAREKYGSLPLKLLMSPAIRLAARGYPVTRNQAAAFQELQKTFSSFHGSAGVFLKRDGSTYQEGELLKQSDLAGTLGLIAKEGRDGFYKGRVARLIADDMARNGGLISLQDLADYRAIERPPVKSTYRDYEVISMGPPSSGGVALIEMLNILENDDLKSKGFLSSRYVHLLTEAMRRAFADRNTYLGDPDFVDVPIAALTLKDYAQSLFHSIDVDHATPSKQLRPTDPALFRRESPQTTHYSVVDAGGMAVSVTTTLNSGYGSLAVVDGAGFLLNNEMDDFAAKPGSPNMYDLIQGEANAIVPKKRMLSSMTPTILAKNDQLFMVIGSPGGPVIINTVLQVILNVVEFDMNIQQAIDAPRLHHQFLPDEIRIEPFTLPVDVVENLTRMGHTVRITGLPSEAEGIVYDARKKVFAGAADPRGEGAVVGW
jgi:gamma-glutamyltranspeptidase / glutathione hydrolase